MTKKREWRSACRYEMKNAASKEAKAKTLISKSVLKSLPEGTIEIGRTFQKQLAGKDFKSELYELKGFIGTDMNLELQSSLDYILKNEEDFYDLC